MVLNLPPQWRRLQQKWSLSGPVETNAALWTVNVVEDGNLSKPDRPFFEAQPVFHDQICKLSLPGFLGIIDSEQKQGFLRAHPAATSSDIHYFLRVVMALVLFHEGNLLVHAAGVVTDTGAYLFVGRSGSGKSTISGLAADRLVLHDDLVYLQPHGQEWIVYAPPGDSVASLVGHSLTNVYLLDHTPDNYLSSVRPAVALAELVANSPVINASPAHVPQLFNFWRSLLNTVPLERLHFRPDHSFWEILDANAG